MCPPHSTAPDDDLAYLTEVVFRLFRAGIQYPLGHTLIDRLADSCLQLLREIFDLEGDVDLEVEPQRLLFNGRQPGQEDAYSLALHALLRQAGVAGISFDRSLTHRYLLLVIRRILARRTGTMNDAAEAGEQVASASCGMKVRFAEDAVVSEADRPAEPFLRQITELAVRLPRAKGQRLQVEMTDLLRRRAIDMPGFPYATGGDATNLLLTALSASNFSEAVRHCGYGERDAAILLLFFDTLADRASQANQGSPLALVCRSWCKSMEKKVRSTHLAPAMVSKERGGRSCSSAALQRFVGVHLAQAPQGAAMRSGDRRPQLSLVLQQGEPASCPAFAHTRQTLLATLLQAPLALSEWQLLKGALQERLEVLGVDHFHSLLSEVLPALRRSQDLSCARCLLDLWHALPPALHMHLWPYAADELLLTGMAGAKRDFYELSDCVGTMPMEVMNRQRSLIERQPAFSKRQLAPRVFCPAYTSTYRFFAFLLDTSLRVRITASVIAELRRTPQDELIAAVIFLLRPEEEDHVRFLADYLRYAPNETFPESVTAAAAQLMVDLLPQLDEKSREEPWLEKTIVSMAIWHGKDTIKVLETIVEERRFAIVPAWNRSCRRAAEIALERLRQRPTVKQTSRGKT